MASPDSFDDTEAEHLRPLQYGAWRVCWAFLVRFQIVHLFPPEWKELSKTSRRGNVATWVCLFLRILRHRVLWQNPRAQRAQWRWRYTLSCSWWECRDEPDARLSAESGWRGCQCFPSEECFYRTTAYRFSVKSRWIEELLHHQWTSPFSIRQSRARMSGCSPSTLGTVTKHVWLHWALFGHLIFFCTQFIPLWMVSGRMISPQTLRVEKYAAASSPIVLKLKYNRRLAIWYRDWADKWKEWRMEEFGSMSKKENCQMYKAWQLKVSNEKKKLPNEKAVFRWQNKLKRPCKECRSLENTHFQLN